MNSFFGNFRLRIILALFVIGADSVCQPLIFKKINSGTKADIIKITQTQQQEVFFLTNKIFSFKDNKTTKLDFPTDGKISLFYALSTNDIWFTINQITSISVLYHSHDGITENIRSPFANIISSMYFTSAHSAVFAGFADIAVYEKGLFKILPPAPTNSSISKLYSKDCSSFWALSGLGELILYSNGIYKILPHNKVVKDFCFADMNDGFFLSEDSLYSISPTGIKYICGSTDFSKVSRMILLKDRTLLFCGEKGLVLSFRNGKLKRIKTTCTDDLIDINGTGYNDIWIVGRNGSMLFSGKHNYADDTQGNEGFSTHKLITYGINTDDEYGVAMADFNGDSKTDIYAVRIYEQNRLYINNLAESNKLTGEFGFAEESVIRNANGVISPRNNKAQNELKLGISVADLDNDGDQDIYLCYLNSLNKMLINNGRGYFRNVSEQKYRACENMKRSNSVVFADVDIDVDLDMFVANEQGTNRLYENNGTGHFTDITKTSGLSSVGGGMCASFADVNNDGLPDLCVSFWYPTNKLYINATQNGHIYFRDITKLTDISKATPSKSNAVAFADINNDGFTDLFIANRNIPNKLYLNNGDGIFTDKTNEYFDNENFMTNGAVFADFDLDGFQDLYITNVGDNVLYKNMGGKCFQDVTSQFGAELSGYCTGCATGDVDNDGDPDLYVANYINGNSSLFLNITEKKSFVKLKLYGVLSNKDAIGAKVWLYKTLEISKKGVLAGYREINGGNGYASISAKEMIFGIEKGANYYALVKFPSSDDTLRLYNLVAGNIKEIYELEGLAALYEQSRKRFVHFFIDQENQPEIVKYILILLLIVFYNLKLHQSKWNFAVNTWLATGFIFIIFIFTNQFLLFEWPSVLFFIAPSIAIGLLVMLHLFIGRILMRRLAQKEKHELREKLSRDLHDDLASTLGSISIYAETLKGMNEPERHDFKKLSAKIAALNQSALQSISDIIWMTSPRNDTLQSLVSKTNNYMFEILTDNNINFRSSLDIPDEPIVLKEKIRNDAFLILKEGLHNIIRHSGAKNVAFKAELIDNHCTILLTDDGVGMSENAALKKGSHGNGLVNMRRRAQESGINFSILPAQNSGVEIRLHFKI